ANLANLAKVSHHYYNGVMKFMMGANNRPGIKKVETDYFRDDLIVKMTLFPSNFPFYGSASLDKSRFYRMMSTNSSPSLLMMLYGPEDPI
ncbi:hypothetical protein PMAYCL1PPCAC_25494, partial [Pristionchus mayeri]